MPLPTPQKDADARCLDCGHALSGLAEARCPECGRIFAFGDPSTWRSAGAVAALARRARRPPGLMHSAVVVVLCGCGLAIGSKFALNLMDPMLLIFLWAATVLVIGVPIVLAAKSSWKLRAASPGRLGLAGWARWSFAPVLGVAIAWAAWSGVAREWRWRFDEPRFRSEAVRALSNPPAGGMRTTKHIGTVGVRQISIVDGRVHFLTTQDDFLYTVELIYSPPGTPPPLGGATLGGGWTFELNDMD